jgi:hypothetical protein
LHTKQYSDATINFQLENPKFAVTMRLSIPAATKQCNRAPRLAAKENAFQRNERACECAASGEFFFDESKEAAGEMQLKRREQRSAGLLACPVI